MKEINSIKHICPKVKSFQILYELTLSDFICNDWPYSLYTYLTILNPTFEGKLNLPNCQIVCLSAIQPTF